MPAIEPLLPSAIAPGYHMLVWSDHPLWRNGDMIDASNNQYDSDGQVIAIDVDGPYAYFKRCVQGSFNYNFGEGDSVLSGENEAGKLPVRLLFDPPLRAVGTHISGVGVSGTDYLGQIWVRLDKSAVWEPPLLSLGHLDSTRGSAPFIGALCQPGKFIREVGFDVMDTPDGLAYFSQVAINDLYYLPK